MRPENSSVLTQSRDSTVVINSVLRNTYILLGLTLVFSALTAGLAMVTDARPMNPIVMLVLYFGLFFVTMRTARTAWGLLWIFALTGFLGYTLGPVLNLYISSYANGTSIVMTSLGTTGVIFFGLSGYAVMTRKDFSYMGGFLTVAILVAFLGSIAAMLFHIPTLQLLVSGAFVLISSGFILFQTSLIINGGERNYIMATIGLYVSLYNIFISLLSIFGALGGNRD